MKLPKVLIPTCTTTEINGQNKLLNRKKKTFYFLSVVSASLFLIFFLGCKKDTETTSFNYDLLYNKKWLTISQATTPVWTYPVTGKSYTDFFDFAKEIFPCVTDDYNVYRREGVYYGNHAQMRCDSSEPELAPPTYFFVDKQNDSIFAVVPLEVPGQPIEILNIRSKVLELAEDKMVLRYTQVVPFTRTLQTITETYKVIP